MDIPKWITNPNRNYQEGLAIYNRIKRNTKKDVFFNAVKDCPAGQLHHNLLLHEIKSCYRIALNNKVDLSAKIPLSAVKPIVVEPVTTPHGALKPIKATKLELTEKTKPVFTHNDIVDVKTLPPVLRELYFKNQELTRTLSGLHQQLKQPLSDEVRQKVASEIASLFNERKHNWETLDEYATNGTMPDIAQPATAEEPGDLSTADIIRIKRRIDTIKINISRVKKQMSSTQKLPQSKLLSRKNKLISWEKELLNLEQQIM